MQRVKIKRPWLVCGALITTGVALTVLAAEVRLLDGGHRPAAKSVLESRISEAMRALHGKVPGAANDIGSQGPQLTDEYDLLDPDAKPETSASPSSGSAAGGQEAARSGDTADAPADRSQAVSAAVRGALECLNRYRKLAGVPPVQLDSSLVDGCRKHARYLLVNARQPSTQGMGAHDEQPGLPGYSEEGRQAAQTSDIAWRSSAVAGVEACMATLFHRIPILRPNLRRVGIGFEGGIMVMNVITGTVGQEDRPVAFPANGETDVPTTFPDELPDPLPSGASHPAGYPVTLQFPAFGPEVGSVQAELRDAVGRLVPVHLSHPEHPACAYPQQNTVCLIPVKPLARNTTYAVHIAAQVSGSPVERSWSFRTLGGPQPGATVVDGAPRPRPVAGPRPAHG